MQKTKAESQGRNPARKFFRAKFIPPAIECCMAQKKEIITTVNGLIETLKDGQEGFRQAADAVKDSELKSLFAEYSTERSRFAGELQEQLRQIGDAEPEDSSSVAGSMHRAWINLKAAVTSGDDHAILAECERGEDCLVVVNEDHKIPSELDD